MIGSDPLDENTSLERASRRTNSHLRMPSRLFRMAGMLQGFCRAKKRCTRLISSAPSRLRRVVRGAECESDSRCRVQGVAVAPTLSSREIRSDGARLKPNRGRRTTPTDEVSHFQASFIGMWSSAIDAGDAVRGAQGYVARVAIAVDAGTDVANSAVPFARCCRYGRTTLLRRIARISA
jgi:hypothetical protein